MMRANDRVLLPPRQLKGNPLRWAMDVPDDEAEDFIMVEVKVMHREHDGQLTQVGHSAGAKYQYPTAGLEYRFHLNPDEMVAEHVGRLAEEAANMVLDNRRAIHEHKKVVISRYE